MKLKHEDIARIAHAAHREYCAAIGEESLPWNKLPKAVRQSIVAGVTAHVENPKMTPRGSHAEWIGLRKAIGWTHGDKKDSKAKTHPCMVPYEQLPEEQRVKDHLFCALVKGLAKWAER